MLFMEVIDIRTDRGAKTGVGAQFATDDETLGAFDSIREIEVPDDSAEFLVDLRTEDSILDTIGIAAAGFERLVGKPPPTVEETAAYDRAYWQEALAARRRA
jgi:hypothetical protein